MNLFQWNEPQIYTFFFVFIRVTGLILFLPIFGDRNVPSVIKILFGLSLSFVAFPLVWQKGIFVNPGISDSVSRTVLAVFSDAVMGMMTGFVARWVFDAVQFAGHFAGTTMGFSIATVLDPHTESQNIAVAELQYILAVFIFFSMNGHHIYLRAILGSFEVIPPAGVDLFTKSSEIVRYLIDMTGAVISLGVRLAAPIVVVVFLMNMAFGIMARAVPQMNVLVVSFAANIILGFFVLLVTLPGFTNSVQANMDQYTPELLKFMKLFGGQ